MGRPGRFAKRATSLGTSSKVNNATGASTAAVITL